MNPILALEQFIEAALDALSRATDHATDAVAELLHGTARLVFRLLMAVLHIAWLALRLGGLVALGALIASVGDELGFLAGNTFPWNTLSVISNILTVVGILVVAVVPVGIVIGLLRQRHARAADSADTTDESQSREWVILAANLLIVAAIIGVVCYAPHYKFRSPLLAAKARVVRSVTGYLNSFVATTTSAEAPHGATGRR